MGGGWIGYVFAIFGCGISLFIIGASTLFLYGVARAGRDKDRGEGIRVTSVTGRGLPDDVA